MSALKSLPRSAAPTRNNPVFLPALLCAALLAAAAFQIALLLWPADLPAPQVAPRPIHFLKTALATDYPAILKAPLFSQDRQPIEGAVRARAANDIGGYTVIGIGLEGAASVALVRGADGVVARIHIGQAVSGWTLSALGRDTLTFVRGGEQKNMVLTAPPPAAEGATQQTQPASQPDDNDGNDNDDDNDNGDNGDNQ